MATLNLPQLGATKQYVGYSSDVKPTNVIRGSTFNEIDTGNAFIWNGLAWLQYTPQQSTVYVPWFQMLIDLQQQILDRLNEIR